MSQQPNQYDPGLFYVAPQKRAWAVTGNTDVVADAAVSANTVILIMPTSASAGRWYISSITPGTGFTVTSSSSETQTTTTYQYKML
jgi:hypothetical protein